MAIYRVRMIVFAASLFFAFAFASPPARAQGPGGGPPAGAGANVQSLANDVAAIKARLDKLEGNIVASDLAGTYSVTGLATTMTALRAGSPPVNATINTSAFRGTVTLNANGTGNASDAVGPLPGCEGSTLTQGTWAMRGFDCSEPATALTWTYADGVITITFLNDGDVIPFNVALGGRLLIIAAAPFHPEDHPPSSDQFLLILTRLR